MSIRIQEVSSRRDLQTFVDFPYRLYKGNPYFVPPLRFDEEATLRKDKNPAYEYCDSRLWLALRDNQVVGRVAAILNKAYVEKWKNKYLRFGWLDFIDDEEVAASLLAEVEKWGRELGMTAVHGPLGFTDLDHEGMLVEGFDQLGTLATLYNYPYYPQRMEALGYRKDVDWVEFLATVPPVVPENLDRIAEIVLRRQQLTILKAKKPKDILPYAPAIFDLINVAYGNLYGVVPLTERQIEYYVKQYFSFIRADFVSIVLDKEGKLAAFGVTMPSLSRALQKANGRLFPFGFIYLLQAMRKNTLGDLYLVAVRPDLQGKGVNALLMREINRSYIRNGITQAESNPQLENNNRIQAMWEYFEAKQHKRRRCYIKTL
ncbi:MAG: N-acetyltransferase [Cyclobacteriaceae bacterium]|nr:N-acetyltransferase [Cyclobacteriaceae bacterium]